MKNITEVAAPQAQSGSANHSGQFAVQWNPSSEEAIEGSTIALGSISLAGGSAKSLVISALPVGAVLSDGQGHTFTATAGQTSVNVIAWNLNQLSVTPVGAANFVLNVTATHASGATATATEGVIVDPFAPAIAVAPISGVEGSAIALNLVATVKGLPGDINYLSNLVISNIPVGAVLSDQHGHSFTSTTSTTQVDVHAWNYTTLTIVAPDDKNFSLSIAATTADADGNTSTTTHATGAITVSPLEPTVIWSPSAEISVEGSSIALGTINATVNGLAGDSNSLVSIVVSGIPVGTTLSDGNGHSFTASVGHTGTDVLGWSLTSLTVIPTTAANFTLTVTATERDAEGNLDAPASSTESITVNPLTPTVSWSPSSETGVEGTPIPLGTIGTTVNGLAADSNSLASLVVSGIPVSATLSDGNGHSFIASVGHTSTDVLSWSLATLTVTPTTDANFTLTVTATERDAEGNLGAPASSTESIAVNPMMPTASWSPSAETGVEGSAIALGTISATVNGVAGDANSLASLVVSGIPVGATLSDGNGHSFTASAGHTSTDVFGWSLTSLTVTPTTAGNFTLTVTATERDADGNINATHSTETVTVNPLAPAASWSPPTETGVEGSPIALGTISTTVNGLAADSNSLASLVVSGIPVGAILSDGNGHSFTASAEHTGTDVLGWSLPSLTVTPTTDANFTLTVTATERDSEGNFGAPASSTESIMVNPLAPTSSWSPSAETGIEGSPIALGTISATVNGVAGDTNSFISLAVSGLPVGATLSDGNGHSFTASVGNTGTDVLGWSLATLTVTPITVGSFTLTLTATERDADGNLATSASSTESITLHSPYTSLDFTGEWMSYAQAINDSGQVAGWYQDNSVVHGFVYSAGTYTALDDPLTTNGTAAQAINGAGEVAGYYYDNSGQPHGFIYNAGTYITLDDPLATNGTVPLAINASGEVAGFYTDNVFHSHGFLYNAGTFTTLDDPLATFGTAPQAMNDSGEVVGYYQDNTSTHGFIYNAGTYITLNDPLATEGTVALGISGNGEVVGYYNDSTGGQHGFIYNAGTYTTLDDPLATGGTYAATINDSGQVAGDFTDNTGQHGFLYSNGTYTTVDEPASTAGTTITAINASGQVAGAYFTPTIGSFIYAAGDFTNLQDPVAATQTYANAINDNGQVVGFDIDNTGYQHGFIYSSGTYNTVDDPLATNGTDALGINGSGQVVGDYTDNNGQHGFLYNAGTYTTLDDPLATNGTDALGINGSGQVVGDYNDNKGQHGFIYHAGAYTTLDDPFATFGTAAQAINATGEVVGSYYDSMGQHGFIYNAGTYITLNDPLATNGTVALRVNGSGEVLGYYSDNTGQHGFIYNAGIYTTLDDPLATGGTYAVALNDSGQVAGYYNDDTGQLGFLYSNGKYTTVENPSTTQNVTGVASINNLGEVVGYYEPASSHGFTTA